MNNHWMAAGMAVAAALCFGQARAQEVKPAAPATAVPAAAAPTGGAESSKAPAGAQAYIISPVQGARIKGPFVVRFGLKGMGVTQAGSTAKDAGHHHLFVDVTGALGADETIPADKNHLHFGGGQTETRLDLPPGRHTLQLVLGDAAHRPFSPSIASPKVSIVVLPPHPPLPRHHRRVRPHRRTA